MERTSRKGQSIQFTGDLPAHDRSRTNGGSPARGGTPASATAEPPPPPKSRHSLRRFLAYVRPYTVWIVIAALCGMSKVILPSTMALALRFLTDRLVAGAAGKTAATGAHTDIISRGIEAYIAWMGHLLPGSWRAGTPWGMFNILMITLVFVYVFWGVTFFFRSYLSQMVGHRVILDLRTDLYQHITRLGHSFFQSRQSGGIVSRLMADIALAQNFVGNAMTNIWMDLASCVFYIYVLFAMDARLAAASLMVFPFYILSMRTLGDKSKKTSRAVQAALEQFSGDVQERMAGIQVVKSFAAERREAKSFFVSARKLFNLTMHNVRISTLANALVQWLTQMATLGIIWYGGYQLMHGYTTVGTVVAFILLLRELYFPVNRISEMNTILHNSLAAIDRVFEVFDMQSDVHEQPNARRLPRISGRIRFDHVTFGYQPDSPILRDIDLDIRPGEVVALVGPSGAGKSTLVQLVPRFFDPSAGRVEIDGIDLRTVALRSLRSQIGIVAQETLLFSGSVRDNLLYGRPSASEEEMVAAARAAFAHEFVMQLPEGYDTLIGERGARLSGGQKQRIAIARAFLCNPRILILDEATSALDSESEVLIQQALARLMRNRTSIVIAHRLSTILNSDRIVVMQQGRMEEVASHQALLARNGLYARLYRAQYQASLAG